VRLSKNNFVYDIIPLTTAYQTVVAMGNYDNIHKIILQRQQVTMVIHTIILFNKEGSVIESHVVTTCHYIKAFMI